MALCVVQYLSGQWLGIFNQNGRRFGYDILIFIFYENIWISQRFYWSLFLMLEITIFQQFVRLMIWCRPVDKPLCEPMMVNLLTHICVTRHQWLKSSNFCINCSRIFCIFQAIPFILNFIQLVVLPQSRGRKFDPLLVHDNFSVPLLVVCVSLH